MIAACTGNTTNLHLFVVAVPIEEEQEGETGGDLDRATIDKLHNMVVGFKLTSGICDMISIGMTGEPQKNTESFANSLDYCKCGNVAACVVVDHV